MNFINTIKNKITDGNERSVAIKKNILWSLIVKGCSIVISFLLVPMTLGYVNSELYGIWLTLSSIVTWLHFLDIGFTNGLKNKLAEAIALKEWERGKALVSTTYIVMILIFIPLCILSVIFIPHINWALFLNVNPIYNNDIIDAMYVLVVCFCCQMILNVLTAAVAAFQKVALSSSFVVIGHFFSLIIIFFLKEFCPPSLMALAFAIASMPIIVILLASFFFYSGKFQRIAPSIKSYERKYVKDIWGLGAKFFLIQIQMLILYQSTNVLISKVSGPEDVTAYNISYKYIGIATMVYTILIQPLWPAFTDAYTKKDFTWMKSIYSKMCKVYVVCNLVILCMVAVSPIAYNLWIGDKTNIPLLMTCSVAIYVMIHAWDSLQVNIINGIGAIRLQTYVTLIGLLFHIPISLFLAQYLGAIGVVTSMMIINFIYLIIFTIQINKLLNNKAKGIWVA